MGFLKNIFRKKEDLVPFDFSLLECDIHSHLVPGIDDGSKSMDDSLALASGLKELGYKKIITTPHIMSDFYKNNPEIIGNGYEQVKSKLVENNIPLKMGYAAEYYIDFDFVNKIGKEKLLTFGNNYILVEFSFVTPPQNINEVFFQLQTNGYKPVLAHPERYSFWNDNSKPLFDLKDRDVLFQPNILSLKGHYGYGALKTAQTLIDNKMVDFLGTDLHNQHQLSELKTLKINNTLNEKIKGLNLLNKKLLN